MSIWKPFRGVDGQYAVFIYFRKSSWLNDIDAFFVGKKYISLASKILPHI